MRLTERTDALCTKSFRDKNRNLWKYIPVKQADGRRITPKDIAGDTGCRSGKTPVGILTGRGRSGKERRSCTSFLSAQSLVIAREKPDTFPARTRRETCGM